MIEAFVTIQDLPQESNDNYYKGVFMAIACSIMGALCNILIKKCEKIRSTVIVFYSGVCGIVVALVFWVITSESKKILNSFEEMKCIEWALLGMISLIGKMVVE